jgi:hypothetical protein
VAVWLTDESQGVVSLAEFMAYVEHEVELEAPDGILAAASMFRALAKDRSLVVDQINEEIRNLSNREVPPPQVAFEARGRGFTVRASLWPSAADTASGRVYESDFSHHLAHDHNYDFLTMGYYGPGCTSEIYRYDPASIEGYVGEVVNLEFAERAHLGPGQMMFYRRHRDVHVQLPPADLSITLNLLVWPSHPEACTDRYYFDLGTQPLAAFPREADSSRRISLMNMAARIGDAETRELIEGLATQHPCARTRLGAYQCLTQTNLGPAETERLWLLGSRDPHRLVANQARRRLTALER